MPAYSDPPIQEHQDDLSLYSPEENRDFNHSPINSANCTVILLFFFLQTPIAIINIFIGLVFPHSKCMDNLHELAVRKWFLGIGISESLLVLGLLLGMTLLHQACINYESYSRWLLGIGALLVLKVIVWGVASVVLFVTKISKLCEGFIWGYGLLSSILAGTVLVMLVCALVSTITTFRFPH